MNIKDRLTLYPWDKLSHYQWASWFAAVVAIAMMAVTSGLGFKLSNTAALGAAASIITALAVYLLG